MQNEMLEVVNNEWAGTVEENPQAMEVVMDMLFESEDETEMMESAA